MGCGIGQCHGNVAGRETGLGRKKLQSSTFIFIHCYTNVLRALYNCPSFDRVSLFISCLFLLFLLFAALFEQRERLSAVPEMALDAGLRCIFVSMNLDFNSNENLFQCRRCLALRSNCISVVCVLYLVQLNISDPCHSVKIVIEEHTQVRKFLVCLIVRGEDAIICGIEIKKISHLLLLFEVEISALPHPQESVKAVRLERLLAEESAELILSSSCCNTTSPIRLRSFLLSCLFYCYFCS